MTIESSLLERNETDSAGYLFEVDTIHARYDGTTLFWHVNGTEISTVVSIKDFTQFEFNFDTTEDEMQILIDDVPVATGGAGVAYTASNTNVFVGSDSNGDNQICGRLNRFRVIKL